jgi:hypothetical protein
MPGHLKGKEGEPNTLRSDAVKRLIEIELAQLICKGFYREDLPHHLA